VSGDDVMRRLEQEFIDGGRLARKLFVSPAIFDALHAMTPDEPAPLRPFVPVVNVVVDPDEKLWRFE